MQILNTGEYTGKIVQKTQIDDTVITNTLYSPKQSNPDWHYHRNLHICFVFQGGKADTRHSTKYTDRDGSIFFYHSEEVHRWVSPQPISKSANVEIGQKFLKKYNLTEAAINENIEKKVDSKLLILKIQKEMITSDLDSDLTVQSLLLELITKPENILTKRPPNWVITLKELLHDNWYQEMTLQEISMVLKVHPVTISKYFRKYFSCTLGEYRRKLKIEKSLDLIKSSNKSLSEIAYDCNFSDQSHFIRNFKASTGFLPSDYRNF